jgi:hypothetical protein
MKISGIQYFPDARRLVANYAGTAIQAERRAKSQASALPSPESEELMGF